MRKILAICAVLAAAFTCQAIGFTNSISFDLGATNWAFVPYGVYDVQTKQAGYGGALLYQVSENFWAGYRMQNLAGRTVTAGVQGQLQVPFKVGAITVIPLVETSVGLGKDSVWAGVGPGGLIRLASVHVGKSSRLTFDLAGVYEHYVDGPKNGDEIIGGLVTKLTF